MEMQHHHHQQPTPWCKVELEGRDVENVSKAVYLRVKISEDGRMEGELERRIGVAMRTVEAMKEKVGNRGLSCKAKPTCDCRTSHWLSCRQR